MPFGWGISNPPAMRQLIGMSAPVTILQPMCRNVGHLRSTGAHGARDEATF